MIKKNRNYLYPLIVMGVCLIFTNSCKKKDDKKEDPSTTTKAGPNITDADGNVYHSVIIGTQVWMVENLKVTKYNDGSAIPNVTDGSAFWDSYTTGVYCNYNNDASNSATYGRLYNWNAVNTGKLAPKGWHVSTDPEWTILKNYLIANGYNYDGTITGEKYAKSLASTTGWSTTSESGTIGNIDYPAYRNKTGFTALPAGWRGYGGTFNDIGVLGYWWTSTMDNNTHHIYWKLGCGSSALYRDFENVRNGFSVRCVKD